MSQAKRIGLVLIGDEILSGRRQDKHLPKSIELLGQRGLRVSWARLCSDDKPSLIETFRQTLASGDIVFSFGGIGATPDDHTRESLARAAGVDLVLHPEAEREIRDKFGAEVNAYRLEMGRFPQGSDIIPNPYNRIPGFSYQQHHCLPGFPQMAWPMMEWVLDTHYLALHNAQAWVEDSIAVFEATEGRLVDIMHALEARYDVSIFSLPHLGSEHAPAHIELGAKGEPEAVAAAMQTMREEVARRAFPVREMSEVRPFGAA